MRLYLHGEPKDYALAIGEPEVFAFLAESRSSLEISQQAADEFRASEFGDEADS